VFWPRRRRERSNLYDNTYDKTNEEERNQNMAIIKAPPKQPKAVTIQARVEESVKTQLDQYAKFIESTPSYVITQALKVLFKRDDEFKAWLGQQSNNGNDRGLEGGALKVTA
jgi:predicted transcriptional regulator